MSTVIICPVAAPLGKNECGNFPFRYCGFGCTLPGFFTYPRKKDKFGSSLVRQKNGEKIWNISRFPQRSGKTT